MKLSGCARVPKPHNAPPSESMPERIPAPIEEKFRKRLEFYQDMGIDLIYRDRFPQQTASIAEDLTLPKSAPKQRLLDPVSAAALPIPRLIVLPRSSDVSLFESMSKIAGVSLP